MARFAPDVLGEVFASRLRAVPGEPDPVTRMLLNAYLARIADQAPDAALELFELLLSRRIQPDAEAWKWLVMRRPEAAHILGWPASGAGIEEAPGKEKPKASVTAGATSGTSVRANVVVR